MIPQTKQRGHGAVVSPIERERRGLLAKIHIAKQQLSLTDDEYELIIGGFKATSAAELTIPQLERLVKYLQKLGWKPSRRGHSAESSKIRKMDPVLVANQLGALRGRCVEIAQEIENGEKRLIGLALKICGVSSLTWCREVQKLERLLAVLGKIKLTESTTN